MDDIEPASPFRRDGITQVPLTRRPLRPTVGRQHFPIRDLRTQPAADSSALERDVAWLDDLYRRDLPLREHSLFSVDDVLVLKGSVWHRGTPIAGTLPPKPAKKGDLVGRIAQKIERAGARARLYPGTTAIIHEAGYRNYYHWTVEIMPRLFSLRDAMREGRVTIDRIVLFDEETRRFVTESLALLLPELAPLVEITADELTRFEHCLFFVDATEAADYSDHVAHSSRLKACSALLAEAVDDRLSTKPFVPPGRAILISRADAPKRRLIGEDRILDALAALGLERIAFAPLGVAEQIALMSQARLVVGVHGAGLTNTIYCRPGTAVVEINSPDFIRRCRSFADIAMHRQLNYGLVVADSVPVEGGEPDIALDSERAMKGLRKLVRKLGGGEA